jgi:hypothetical protein
MYFLTTTVNKNDYPATIRCHHRENVVDGAPRSSDKEDAMRGERRRLAYDSGVGVNGVHEVGGDCMLRGAGENNIMQPEGA